MQASMNTAVSANVQISYMYKYEWQHYNSADSTLYTSSFKTEDHFTFG